jgi:hypothetical protein
MADNLYIRQWVEVGGILFAEIGLDLDNNEIENEELEDLELPAIQFHAGWFDAIFREEMPKDIGSKFIFDYLCGWYSARNELATALMNCSDWQEF